MQSLPAFFSFYLKAAGRISVFGNVLLIIIIKKQEIKMQNYQSITLDVNNCVDYVYVNAKQGDIDSRFLKITLTEKRK